MHNAEWMQLRCGGGWGEAGNGRVQVEKGSEAALSPQGA